MPLENRWKCCEACRERTRLYQRARQNGEVEPQRRNINAELAAVDRILGDASRVVVGSSKCTMRFCMHILPPAGEYKYKMCASCRSYVRSTKKATPGGKENGAEEHPKKVSVLPCMVKGNRNTHSRLPAISLRGQRAVGADATGTLREPGLRDGRVSTVHQVRAMHFP